LPGRVANASDLALSFVCFRDESERRNLTSGEGKLVPNPQLRSGRTLRLRQSSEVPIPQFINETIRDTPRSKPSIAL